MLSYEEYKTYYERKGRFPDNSYVSPNGYNDRQLLTKYGRYVKSQEKVTKKYSEYQKKWHEKNQKRLDEKWEKLKEIVDKRDKHSCRLYRLLTVEEINLVKNDLFGKLKTIDRAHVFRRSSYPHLKYESENVYCLYRLFHSRLDQYQNPLTGAPTTKEEIEQWWRRIVGNEKYDWLLSQIDKRKRQVIS